MWNLISDFKALIENSVSFVLSTIWWLDALKRREKLSEKGFWTNMYVGMKKPGLNFNAGLALIGLPTTGPRGTNG